MSKIKHVLFDCDGVLVDTEYTAAIKMCQALKDAGVKIELEHYLRVHSGTTFSAILEHYFGDTMPSTDKADLMRKVEAEVADAVQPVAGISSVLTAVKIEKSVVSNSSIATVRHAFEVAGIERFFSGRIFSSEQVPKAKPAPDLYLFALETLGLDSAQVLVVEDSRTGVQAAVSAGLTVIGFTGASHILPGHEDKLLEQGAIAIASSPSLLKAELQSRTNL